MWCLRGTQHRAAAPQAGRERSAAPRAIPTSSAPHRPQQQQQRRQQPRPHAAHRGVATAAAEVAEAAAAAVASLLPSSASDAKSELRRLLEGSGRGFRVGRYQRGMIEEAQVNVEGFAPQEIDFQLLEGKWRLLYTTAADVIPILESESRLAIPFGPSLVSVGDIYQRFTGAEEGTIENIIELGAPFFLRDKDGLTLTVRARYDARGPRRIALVFESANVGGVHIGEGFEALLAPAMLPRTSLQHQLLLALSEFSLTIPFASAGQLASRAAGENSPVAGGGDYQLTFLDESMLIGRASALGGSFIFERAEE